QAVLDAGQGLRGHGQRTGDDRHHSARAGHGGLVGCLGGSGGGCHQPGAHYVAGVDREAPRAGFDVTDPHGDKALKGITRREARFGASHTQCESACKPDSVEDGHPSGPHVTAGLLRPTRDSIGGPPASLLGLAPGGVCRAGPVARSAGGLLLHPFTLACARRPSAVCSLLHFPSGHPAWELPSTLPCGVRTFLGLSTATVQRTRNVKSIGGPCVPGLRASPSRRRSLSTTTPARGRFPYWQDC